MNPEELEHFQKILLEMQESLMAESSTTVQEMKKQSSLFPDPNDRAALETERNTTLRIRDRERKLLSKVQEALERIENQTFGLCENCGELIAKPRLEVRPVTTFCINCKEEIESEES